MHVKRSVNRCSSVRDESVFQGSWSDVEIQSAMKMWRLERLRVAERRTTRGWQAYAGNKSETGVRNNFSSGFKNAVERTGVDRERRRKQKGKNEGKKRIVDHAGNGEDWFSERNNDFRIHRGRINRKASNTPAPTVSSRGDFPRLEIQFKGTCK